MEVLWRTGALTVRDVSRLLGDGPPLAYTTVMTTLDRLYKKGLLAREKDGNAFVYRPALSRDEYHRGIVGAVVRGLVRKSAAPVLAAFVDAVASVDEQNLRRLERLIAERKRFGQ
jgi:predicted transcriptional regulator